MKIMRNVAYKAQSCIENQNVHIMFNNVFPEILVFWYSRTWHCATELELTEVSKEHNAFITLGNTKPVTLQHIQEHLNPQQNRCRNLKSRIHIQLQEVE
jgi:hypothetical protein